MANTAINHDPVATFPGSSTNTAVVKWSGTSGNALLDSGVIIDASNNVTGLNNVTATGYLHLTGDEKELRFYEGANYIAIAAPSGLGADYTFTLPLNDGSADEFLQTNGSGVLVWAAVHAEAHTVVSHSDTTATGAELETLTDGSTTALHAHSGGGPSQANQAAIEAETNEDTYVPPDLVKNSPGVAKVWCHVERGTGTPSLDSPSYNVASVSDNGSGQTQITIDTDFSSAIYSAGASATTISDAGHTAHVESLATATFAVEVRDSGTTLQDTADFCAWAFGDQ